MSLNWEDREVLQEVWNGKLPAVFNLSEKDVKEGEDDPGPCYIMLPRMSYLPLATDKVKRHFSSHQSQSSNNAASDTIWFSYKGTPLRWHHPIGLLHDLLHIGNNGDTDTLPWEITVHLSQFPSDTLLPCHSRDQVETVFMSSLKEADQLKHSGKVVSQMQKKDHNQLWLGLTSDKFDQFWAINRKLMEPLAGQDDTFRHIPVRWYIGGVDNSGTVTNNIVQRLVSPNQNLGEVINDMGWSSARLYFKMAGPPKSRGMLQYVFKHFMESFKVGKRQKVGNLIGKDPYGNSYYELPAQPQLGKRRPTRWYNTGDITEDDAETGPSEKWGGFDAELPAEWESWLRHRRAEPPTEKEVLQSLALSQMKKINAAKLEDKRRAEMLAAGLDPNPPKPQDHEKTPYPKYDEYEITPGDLHNDTIQDKWGKHKNPYQEGQNK